MGSDTGFISIKEVDELINNNPIKTNFMLRHIKQIFEAHERFDITDVYIYDICPPFGEWALVSSKNTGELFLVCADNENTMYSLLATSDSNALFDGELRCVNVSWICNHRLLVFYKHYLVSNTYQQVIVRYESSSEFRIYEGEIVVLSESFGCRDEIFDCEHIYTCLTTGDMISELDIDFADWLSKRKPDGSCFRLTSDTSSSSSDERDNAYITAPGEPHIACVLLLDTSASMEGEAIAELNKAVCDFKEQVCMDEIAKKRVDVAIVEFNDTTRIVQDFAPLTQLQSITLSAKGDCSMGNGIDVAIDMVKNRNRFYNELGVPCYKPYIVMISMGAPTDDISSAMQKIAEEENKGTYGKGKLKFWALGISGYDTEVLRSLTRRCFALTEINFIGFFDWLSEDMAIIGPSFCDQKEDLPLLPVDVKVMPDEW